MSEKKVCRRFKLTPAGRRCAKYDTGSYRRCGQKRTGKCKPKGRSKR